MCTKQQNAIAFIILESIDKTSLLQVIEKVRDTKETTKEEKIKYKRRVFVKFRDKIQSISVEDVSYIYAEGKMIFIFTKSTNRKYAIEYSLDELEKTY